MTMYRTTTAMILAGILLNLSAPGHIQTYKIKDASPPRSPVSITTGSPQAKQTQLQSTKSAQEAAFERGEYKTVMQLVSILSHGKKAKGVADFAIK